jgi:hypothetical protein
MTVQYSSSGKSERGRRCKRPIGWKITRFGVKRVVRISWLNGLFLGSDFDESCQLHQDPKEHGVAMLGEREDAVAPELGDLTVMLDNRLPGESWQLSVDPLQDIIHAPRSSHYKLD